jgi:phage shock protein PspC (stress-responsive transcriptional regulator)
MSTTDTLGAPPQRRVLRRPHDGRVAAGVSAGLGEYFGVDPVLFRVLFATSAFFGGAGILAYLLAWAAIPDEGTERAPIDGWAATLRRRRIPVWAVAVTGGLFLWLAAFSWWAPGPFVPVIAVGVIVAVLLGRRESRLAASGPAPDEPDAVDRVSLTKDDAETPIQPPWAADVRAWAVESRAASRARRRRALPVKLTTLILLVAVLTTLGVVDAVTGVALQYYFWSTLGLVVLGLLVGLVLRRTPWSIAILLPLALLGTLAFGGSHARLHDGVGKRTWTPVAGASTTHYRLAFGRGDLDLTKLATTGAPARIDVTVAAGEVRVLAPKSLALTVRANVHIGQIDVDARRGRHDDGGVGVSRTVRPPAGATGRAVTVNIHLADGRVLVEHR